MQVSTAKEIWETLSRIDVSNHIEEKMKLKYLSWAWAWGVLMEHYPDAVFTFDSDTVYPDGSVSVNVTVKIGECARSMWLPVMDNKNNAIKSPDARKISDAKMRCLVKCLAMFGLGHYIYAGEDLPQSEPVDEFKDIKDLLDNDEFNFAFEYSAMPEELQMEFFSSFEKGQITKTKQRVRDAVKNAYAQADVLASDILDYVSLDDKDSVKSEIRGLSKHVLKHLASKWDYQTKEYVRCAIKEINTEESK